MRPNLPQWRRLYPFDSHYLRLGALRYHYLDEGAGESVVMVHGNPTWSFYYRNLISALRPRYRCVVPDHIGCGLSDKPGDDAYDYTLQQRVDDLDALIEHLDLGDGLTLVVHDWGGMIGMAWALRRPERIRRLVVMNTAAFLLPQAERQGSNRYGMPAKRLPWRLRVLHRRGALASLAVQGFNLFSRGAALMATKKGLARDVRAGLMAPYDSWKNRIATLRFVQDIPLSPRHPSYDLAKWVDENLYRLADVPMLICWGEHDFVFDGDFLNEWRRRFPKAEVHTFADAGHYVLEDACEEIIPLVEGFLLQHPSKSAAPVSHRSKRARRDVLIQSGAAPAEAGGSSHWSSPRTTDRASSVTTDPGDGSDPRAGDMVNVAAYLPAMARRQPDRPAIVFKVGRDARGRATYDHWTFAKLDRETDRYAYGLERAGIRPGTRTLLMVHPSTEFFALCFALYKVGVVVVLIDPGMGKRRMVQCLAKVEAEAFIGIPLAHLLRVLHPSAFKSIRINVTVGRRWCWGGLRLADLRTDPWEPYKMAPTAKDQPAAIIFTTGSTGPPKGVLFTHGMFDAQVRILREQFDIQPDEIDLPTFPLFALFDPALGMTAVLPDMDPTRPAQVDPVKIIEAIQDQGVTHMFGSPALLNRVGRYGEAHGVKLPSLRRVISAGAPAPPETLRCFSMMLNTQTQIFTPYGATEALPVASIGSREILSETAEMTTQGAGTCVGLPVPEVEVRIIRITDEPIATWSDELELPTGQIGEIVVKGAVVTREYCTDPAATRLAKIRDGASVRHRMGDVGRFDEHGRLWFCGRKAHRVITPNGTLFTVPCEAIFNQHPAVFRSALVAIGRPPKQRPVICVELEQGVTVRIEKLFQELSVLGAKHQITRTIETFLIHPGFPVDIRHNAKIFREKLAVWAADQLKPAKPLQH